MKLELITTPKQYSPVGIYQKTIVPAFLIPSGENNWGRQQEQTGNEFIAQIAGGGASRGTRSMVLFS